MLTEEIRSRRSLRELQRIPLAQRLVVFYARDADEWGDLGPVVERLIVAQNRPVTYLTSDPHDPILEKTLRNLRVFFVGRGATCRKLFRSLETNVVVVARPHVDHHIPRSEVCDVQYTLILSTLCSAATAFSPKQLAPYGTLLCAGEHQIPELRDLVGAEVQLVDHGSARMDSIQERKRRDPEETSRYRTPSVLVAPAGPEFFATAGESIVRQLLDAGLKVTVYLHPDLEGRERTMKRLKRLFKSQWNFTVNRRVPALNLLYNAQLVVSDWSDVALHYALGMERPVLFVDVARTDRRARGTDQRRPLELALRKQLGELLSLDRIHEAGKISKFLLENTRLYRHRLEALRERLVFNNGICGAIGSTAIEALTMECDLDEALRRAIEDLRRKNRDEKPAA